MKKIVIIGSNGMAGHIIYNYFKEYTDFNVVDVARSIYLHVPTYQMDVTDFNELEEILKREMPSVVINCIGILNKEAENRPDKAILLNSYFPHFLAKSGNENGFKLIHISTDCVFNGKKGGYTELSVKDGVGFYAATKALGEINYGKHLTLRTSIIGPELKDNGIGLFHWFMQQHGIINGYKQAYWTGVTTLELAKSLIFAIKQDISGLHHLVNDFRINKYDLVSLFKETFQKAELEIEAFDDYIVDKSLIRTRNDFYYTVQSYEIMINEMKCWIESHPHFYPHYRINVH
jgi:dTDP-4-dehydrorhamnose reductase